MEEMVPSPMFQGPNQPESSLKDEAVEDQGASECWSRATSEPNQVSTNVIDF